MLIEEIYRNASEGYVIGESGLYTPFTDKPGELFKALRREYGKCVSKVYVDKLDNTVSAIGWVFQKLQKYEDCNKTYLAETWVTLHDDKPTVDTTYHYHELKG